MSPHSNSTRRFYDISRQLYAGIPVWPGDRPFAIEWSNRRSQGDETNVAALSLGVHTGTHLDAPFHLLDEGATVDALPIGVFVGPAVVIDARGSGLITEELIGPLLDAAGSAAERILLRTGAWKSSDQFPSGFRALEPGIVPLLAASGVLLVGTDAPSVDPFTSADLPAHQALLGAGIAILENLVLDAVPPGAYELIALPLRISGADASPVRAVLRGP
jgi:arylformamidase